jgi:hypothetical protein
MRILRFGLFRPVPYRFPSPRGLCGELRICLSVRPIIASICLIAASVAPVLGEGSTLVSIGYNKPELLVSPGQIVTFFVTGLQTVLSQPQRAGTVPLPTSLAGISVDIEQVLPIGTTNTVYSAPLLGVEQIDNCGLPGSHHADCLVTAVTAQIPDELSLAPSFVLSPKAIIIENGTPSREFTLSLVADSIHVLTRCETTPVQNHSRPK